MRMLKELNVFIFGALFSTVASTVPALEPDFTSALVKITQAKPATIDYKAFCQETHKGKSKLACRVNGVPSVGFLVCQRSKLKGLPCEVAIAKEMDYIDGIRSARIRVVKTHPALIKNVKCSDTKETNCLGFLEEWIDGSTGWMVHLANNFKVNTVDKLISDIKQKVTPLGLKQTATDLVAVRKYIGSPPLYSQICDLQGFFLRTGGFIVSDPAGIRHGLKENESCYPPDEPTTKQVIEGLEKMIRAFGGQVNREKNA